MKRMICMTLMLLCVCSCARSADVKVAGSVACQHIELTDTIFRASQLLILLKPISLGDYDASIKALNEVLDSYQLTNKVLISKSGSSEGPCLKFAIESNDRSKVEINSIHYQVVNNNLPRARRNIVELLKKESHVMNVLAPVTANKEEQDLVNKLQSVIAKYVSGGPPSS